MNGAMSIWFVVSLAVFLPACRQPAAEKESPAADPLTPVTASLVQREAIHDSLELNATSSFLQNNYVKATSTGYIREVDAKPGEYVKNDKVLFKLETKESAVIGHSISSLDTAFNFNGMTPIRATGQGYITQLNHQAGDYVQDGEQLAVISDMNSFVFLLNLPYELRPFVLNKRNVELVLPDGVRLHGIISSVMPTVDSSSQTQTVVISVNTKDPIPQNLIAKVHIPKNSIGNAQTLPRSAILTDETQSNFWVMKMIDSVTAVKTAIKKGIEWKDRVQILEPSFSPSDLILVTGNYGLPDTAKVIIEKP
jgi:multidrug efflux pump subunit AcrA (membrane-fusion protein)